MPASAPLSAPSSPPEWRQFAGVFHKLKSPLRPSPGDVANTRSAIAGHDGRVLLLGVTPELSVLGRDLTAIDNSPRMIAGVWPGDSESRRAMLGDWTDLPFDDGTFDAVIGDAPPNAAAACAEAVIAEASRVLRPGGKAVFRVFCSPAEVESLETIRRRAGASGNLHALKWRIAMSIAAAMPGSVIPVRAILDAFNRMFPDRAQLAADTGWSPDDIATLDAYSGADYSLGFPTVSRVRELARPFFAQEAVLANAGYPLAERCPTFVWSAR